MTVHELISDTEIEGAYPLMAELRTHLRRTRFVAVVRMQQIGGYRLFGGSVHRKLVALAGVRRSHTLARGEHLFVDDLVVLKKSQGRGHGRALMLWLGRWAAGQGLSDVYLDSRASVQGFYQSLGFSPKTSVPHGADIASLLARGVRRQGR